jgi:hypothetical protein
MKIILYDYKKNIKQNVYKIVCLKHIDFIGKIIFVNWITNEKKYDKSQR